MPRPKPSYAEEPIPGSVSISRKLRVAGARLKARRPVLALRDFSDLLSRALSDYLEAHYPGLIAEVDTELSRGAYTETKPDQDARAAETEQPVNVAKGTAPLSGNSLAELHLAKRAKKKKASKSGGGIARAGAETLKKA
jgi:hypothetical protein